MWIGLDNLSELSIAKQLIKYFYSTTFRNIKSLTMYFMIGNQIENLSKDLLSKNIYLQNLILSECRIKIIDI